MVHTREEELNPTFNKAYLAAIKFISKYTGKLLKFFNKNVRKICFCQ